MTLIDIDCTMKMRRMLYRVTYSIRNYYIDHRYVVYLPILIVIGMILGISFASSHNSEITNFIDCIGDKSYNYGLVFMREFSLYILVVLCALTCHISRYFHILACSSLVMVGYRFGYTIAALIIGSTMNGIISVILINIPFVLIASCALCVMYSMVASGPNIYCFGRSHYATFIIKHLITFTIIYTLLILLFHILIPKIIILIFL